MLRDSCGEAMAPFLCANYGESVVLHGSAVTVDTFDEELTGLPDVVVLEAAERYAENLLSQSRLVLAWPDRLEPSSHPPARAQRPSPPPPHLCPLPAASRPSP